MGKTVVVHDHGKDKYGRTLATLEVAGKIVNAELVAGGWAWHYTRYSKDQTLAAAQLEAQARKRGLWADARPIPPWEWRATAKDRKAVPAGK
jgi:endonuclease YncB( thermonuclease family)